MSGLKENSTGGADGLPKAVVRLRIRFPWAPEHGNTMVILTVGLTVFLLVAGLVIDYGLKYRARQQLQIQVDASALAGTQELPLYAVAKQSAAKFYALGISNTNPPVMTTAKCDKGSSANTTCYSVNSQSVSITTPYTKQGTNIPSASLIHVSASRNVEMIFAKAIGIPSVKVGASATAQAGNCSCKLLYPYPSSNPRTSVTFNESEVLAAFTTNYVGSGDSIKLWYTDEHAMTLGIRQVINAGAATTNNYPVSPLTQVPDAALAVQVGNTSMTGKEASTDPVGRPEWPAAFITDVTKDTASVAGDWQFGGTPYPPTAVFGTWKAAVKTFGSKKASDDGVVPDDDPAKNDWDLGPGSDAPPPGLKNEGYGAEVRWEVDDLLARGIIKRGHIYRIQFMVHDGDQHQAGGDCGEGCAVIAVDESCSGGLID